MTKFEIKKEMKIFNNENMKIMNIIKEDSYKDDFNVETTREDDPRKHYKNRKEREDISKKLGAAINQAIDEKDLLNLFTDYRRTQLKEKINEIKRCKIDFSKIHKKI